MNIDDLTKLLQTNIEDNMGAAVCEVVTDCFKAGDLSLVTDAFSEKHRPLDVTLYSIWDINAPETHHPIADVTVNISDEVRDYINADPAHYKDKALKLVDELEALASWIKDKYDPQNEQT